MPGKRQVRIQGSEIYNLNVDEQVFNQKYITCIAKYISYPRSLCSNKLQHCSFITNVGIGDVSHLLPAYTLPTTTIQILQEKVNIPGTLSHAFGDMPKYHYPGSDIAHKTLVTRCVYRHTCWHCHLIYPRSHRK